VQSLINFIHFVRSKRGLRQGEKRAFRFLKNPPLPKNKLSNRMSLNAQTKNKNTAQPIRAQIITTKTEEI
jgi:hypothetical protein